MSIPIARPFFSLRSHSLSFYDAIFRYVFCEQERESVCARDGTRERVCVLCWVFLYQRHTAGQRHAPAR